MAENTFNSAVTSLFNGMEGFMGTKTVVGEPVTVKDTIIIPLMDVSFGMGTGNWARDTKNNTAGGLGGKLSPCAVMIINKSGVKIVPVAKTETAVSKLMDMIPELIDKYIVKNPEKMDPEVEVVVEEFKKEAEK